MKNNWIELNKAQPNFGIPVLVCDSNEGKHSIRICILMEILKSKTKEAEVVSYSFVYVESMYDPYISDVTHWMPLPEFPNN